MKVKCEVCGNQGQLQHISKNYYRVKHYLGSENGKLRFEYTSSLWSTSRAVQVEQTL